MSRKVNSIKLSGNANVTNLSGNANVTNLSGNANVTNLSGKSRMAMRFRHSMKWQRLVQKCKFLSDEDGSASVELVIFAMPLFIPLLMLASHTTAVSSSKIETSHLARTALRAFVTAPSTSLGHARIQQVLRVPDATDSNDFGSSGRFSYLIECRRLPCIQPSNRVRITIKDSMMAVEVVATLHTDQWIKGEPGSIAIQEEKSFGYRDVTDIEEEVSPLLEAKDLVDRTRELLDVLRGK